MTMLCRGTEPRPEGGGGASIDGTKVVDSIGTVFDRELNNGHTETDSGQEEEGRVKRRGSREGDGH